MTQTDVSQHMTEPQQSAEEVSKHPYARILVALDGSAQAEEALRPVEPLANAFNSTVICIVAVERLSSTFVGDTTQPAGYVPARPLAEAEDEIRQEDVTYLAHLKERLARQGLAVDCEVVKGSPAKAIIDSARRYQADLIAMTTHGRHGLDRAVFGSVADGVVQTASCPVLLVRTEKQV